MNDSIRRTFVAKFPHADRVEVHADHVIVAQHGKRTATWRRQPSDVFTSDAPPWRVVVARDPS